MELKLWKRNWQSKQRSLERQKKLRKLKLDKRRVWIQEQIDKGYMHKSCKVLVHSRAKFPFEDGFVCTSKRLKKAATDDNTAPLIKGMYVVLNQKYFLNKYRIYVIFARAVNNLHQFKIRVNIKGVVILRAG